MEFFDGMFKMVLIGMGVYLVSGFFIDKKISMIINGVSKIVLYFISALASGIFALFKYFDFCKFDFIKDSDLLTKLVNESELLVVVAVAIISYISFIDSVPAFLKSKREF